MLKRKSFSFPLFFLLTSTILGRAQDNSLAALKTRAEATDYIETSRHDDVLKFAEVVSTSSDKIHLTFFGYTTEGRKLPLLIVSETGSRNATDVLNSGRTRIFIHANIHAGEVCGKEAMLMLLRKLAQGEHDAWLSTSEILIAPIYNADGNERVSLYNRPRQHGPFGGMGQRANAQDYDLNRDHMKLDSPEARALVGLLNDYDPHVVVDLHTTNGTRHGYHLTYSPPLNPNTPQKIDSLLRQSWFPEVTRAIREKYGWEFYYYGNLPWRGMDVERGWYTFDHRPRFNSNYVGLRNRFGILSEAYSYATFEERVLATLYFVEELLNFAHGHAPAIREFTDEADRESVVGRPIALRAHFARSGEPAEILLGEVVEEINPFSGATVLRRKDVSRIARMPEFGHFEGTETIIAPIAYFVPNDLKEIVNLLKAHGIEMAPLAEARTLPYQRFRIDSTSTAEREYEGRRQLTLFGAYEESEGEVQAGTYIVPVNQKLGRLVVYLLEPRSDDGVVNWSLLPEEAGKTPYYPIFRQPSGF